MAFKLRLKPELVSGIQLDITGTNLTYQIGLGSAVPFTGGSGVDIPANAGLDMITIEGTGVSLIKVKSDRFTLGVTEAHLDEIEPEMTSLKYFLSGQDGLVTFTCAADLSSITDFFRAWSYCLDITSFPYIDTSSGTDFNGAWANCSTITSFPQLDFSSGTDFSNAWLFCSAITSFPAIDTSKGVNFLNAWYTCTALECLSSVDTTSATSTVNMFKNTHALVNPNASEQAALAAPGGAVYVNRESTSACYVPPPPFKLRLKPETSAGVHIDITGTNLTYKVGAGSAVSFIDGSAIDIPGNVGLDMITIEGYDVSLIVVKLPKRVIEAHLDKVEPVLTSLVSFLEAQNVLTTFTCSANTSKIFTFYSAWYNCSNLTSFPLIDTSSGDNLNSAWYGCSSLTSFPKIDTSKVIRFYNSWEKCSNLISFPQITTSQATHFEYMWGGCSKLECIGGIDTTSAESTFNMFRSASALVNPNASEQAALADVASGGAVYENRESTSPCYILPTFKLRLKPETSSGVQLDITGDNLTYKIGAGSAVSFTGGTGVAIPGNVGLDMITIEGYDVSLIKVKNTLRVTEAHLDAIGNNLITLYKGFANQFKITSFTCNADLRSVTNFVNTWDGCAGLTSFPYIDTSSATTLNYAWSNCSGLTSFPDINTSNAVSFNSTWKSCNSLTTFPLLNTSKCESFINTWGSCKNLTLFPAIDTSNGISFNSTWQYCEKLTAFPRLNTIKATNFYGTWTGCKELLSFPELDSSKSIYFHDTWKGCTKLKCIGGVDTTAATDTYRMFSYIDALIHPNASEQAALMDVASGGAVYVNKESTSPCYTYSNQYITIDKSNNIESITYSNNKPLKRITIK